MSGEVLRDAAALMRARADRARAGVWYADGADVLAAWSQPRPITTCDGSLPEGNEANAEHIASWHPSVALAVADWLDRIAWTWELDASLKGRVGGDEALAVATAYLGRTS